MGEKIRIPDIFFFIFLTFSSPKDIHKAYSDLIGIGFDSKSSNHKQWSYSSYDSSDPPEENEYPVPIAVTLIVLSYELTYSSGIANMFYMQTSSVSLAYWKHPVVKVILKIIYTILYVLIFISATVFESCRALHTLFNWFLNINFNYNILH